MIIRASTLLLGDQQNNSSASTYDLPDIEGGSYSYVPVVRLVVVAWTEEEGEQEVEGYPVVVEAAVEQEVREHLALEEVVVQEVGAVLVMKEV